MTQRDSERPAEKRREKQRDERQKFGDYHFLLIWKLCLIMYLGSQPENFVKNCIEPSSVNTIYIVGVQ